MNRPSTSAVPTSGSPDTWRAPSAPAAPPRRRRCAVADRLNHIGGKEVPAASHRTLALIDPAAGLPHGTAPLSGPEDVDAACRAARQAFSGWKAMPPGHRQTALLRIADALEREADALAD